MPYNPTHWLISTQLAEQCGSWTLGQCDDEYKAWVGCIFTTTFARGGLDCEVDCDNYKDSDGALGLTTTLAAAVAVAAAF